MKKVVSFMKIQPDTRDYFAELYVAGILGDAKWNVYFPKRDYGFDFIITKKVGDAFLIRPVQVKGLYPTSEKTNNPQYGFIGNLTQVHPEMVLAIAFFPINKKSKSPTCVAYLPYKQIRKRANGNYSCLPAQFKSGIISSRRDYKKFFDEIGVELMELSSWRNEDIGQASKLTKEINSGK